MRYHYTPIREATIQTLTPPNTGVNVDQQELSFTIGENAKLKPLLENSLAISCKAKHRFTIIRSSNCPNEMKIYAHKKPAHKCVQQLHS